MRETFTSPRGSTTLKHFPLQSKFVGFRLAAPPGARLSLASRLWPVGGQELCRWRIIGGRQGGSQHPGKLDHHLRSPHLTPTWMTGKDVVGEPKLEKGWIIRTAVTASAGGTMHKGESATEGRSLRPKQCRPPTKGRANRGKEKTMRRQMTSSRCEMVCGTRWWPPAGVERPPLRTK